MKWLNELWNDEAGSVVSAELVLLGTLGAVGVGVGAAAIGDSVDAEFEELAYSLRSLDQSYSATGFHGCGSWTAGSGYTQRPVRESLRQVRRQIYRERAALEQELRDAERARDEIERDRDRDRDERMQDDRGQERRRRMREREREQELRDGESRERWDGDERPEPNDAPRETDEANEDAAT